MEKADFEIISIGQKKQYYTVGRELRSYEPRCEKNCLRGFTNNTGADQPAHMHSLIIAFVILFLESIIWKLATGNISIFKLVSVAEETGFSLALLETPKTGYLTSRPINVLLIHDIEFQTLKNQLLDYLKKDLPYASLGAS